MAPATGVGPRDPKKVVMVSRFDHVKGQIPVLSAFKEVLKIVPDAQLELYGRGADERKIRDEIDRLGLGDSVNIPGFTADASQVFSEAAVSIVASTYEGFCLSMGESMAAGCVPVSYGFKYGPQDLIRPGIDAMLVEPGNVKDLADSISFLLLNEEHRERMSQASTTIVDRISEARLIDEWRKILGY
nr:glycosyltransferase [Pseudarthrobacter albicanus]